MSQPSPDDVARWHRWFAVELNNRAWELHDQAGRTAEEDRELLAAAHGARWHWYQVGEPANFARADHLVARAHAALGDVRPAVEYARLCLDRCRDHGLGAWDTACGLEAVARGARLAGDGDLAADYAAQARAAAAGIEDDEDREYFLATLTAGLP